MSTRSIQTVAAAIILATATLGGVGGVAATTTSPRSTTSPSSVANLTWSKPQLIERPDCAPLALAIDAHSRYHLVAGCDGSIRYSVSDGDGAWATTTFAHAANRQELDPQVAIDGDVAYVAYTRIAVTDGGCGDNGLRDVGVYYRQRTLPDGAWSSPRRLGLVDDHLQSLRVAGGTLHATVLGADGLVHYQIQHGTAAHRYLLPGAVGGSSLRIGNDGRAGIAFEAAGSIHYSRFTGTGFVTSTIAGSAGGFAPLLVLGKDDSAYVLWTRAYHGHGCVEPGPDPRDGTYFATNASGRWVSGRFSTDVGQASLTLDPATGRLHAVVSSYTALTYYTKPAGGRWSPTAIPGNNANWPVIRQDPATGRLVVAYSGGSGGPGDLPGVYVVTAR